MRGRRPRTPAAGGHSSPSPRFVALKSRDFRFLWTGTLISTMGTQMQLIALNWHLFLLLEGKTVQPWPGGPVLDAQPLGLGGLGLARVLPLLLLALLAGALADARSRRKQMLVAQSAMMGCAALLTVLTATGHVTVPTIYLIVMAIASAQAFDNPARQSMVPHLVPRSDVPNAISLNTVTWQIGTIFGPGLAGLLIAASGVGVVYALDTLSFIAVIGALLAIRYRGGRAATSGVSIAAIREGLRFTFSRKIVWSTMVLDFLATLFSSARSMLPLISERALGAGVQGYGILATAQPVGGLVAGLVTASRPPMRRQGRVLLASVGMYGVATALFGLTSNLLPAYILFALTGAGDMVSTVIRGTIRQLETPDRLRGRVTSVNSLFFLGGPQLGEVEAGAVAALFGVRFAVFTGGLATVALVPLTRWRYPELANYDAPDRPPAGETVIRAAEETEAASVD